MTYTQHSWLESNWFIITGVKKMTKKEHLYNFFKPKHYDIFLDINREKKFSLAKSQ